MSHFIVRHIAESTFFALILSAVATGLRRNAAARYAVWFLAAVKFALPTVGLSRTGEDLAAFIPAAPWLSLLTYRLSVLLARVNALLPADEWQTALLACWLGVSTVILLFWWARYRRLKSNLTAATAFERAALHRARLILPVDCGVRILRSPAHWAPALVGVWRPAITVPAGLSEKLSPAEFQGVVLHELAHARRRDNFTATLVYVIRCLFWFHPLLWFIERRLKRECEHACDATVLAAGVSTELYAAAILKVCRFQLLDAKALSGVSALSGADLRHRLRRIQSEEISPNSERFLYVPWLLMAALTILMTFIPVAGGYCAQCSQTAAGIADTPNLDSRRN